MKKVLHLVVFGCLLVMPFEFALAQTSLVGRPSIARNTLRGKEGWPAGPPAP